MATEERQIDGECAVCGEWIVEIPADEADWPLSVMLWVTEDGTWACNTTAAEDEAGGPFRLHVPEMKGSEL